MEADRKMKIIFGNYKLISKKAFVFVLIFSLCLLLAFSSCGACPEHRCAENACHICLAAALIKGFIKTISAVFVFLLIISESVYVKKINCIYNINSAELTPVSMMNVIIS